MLTAGASAVPGWRGGCNFAYHGTFHAQVSGASVPMFRIIGELRRGCSANPDGAWFHTMREAGWFCDLASGEPVNEATNPLNGKLVKPPLQLGVKKSPCRTPASRR